MKLQDCVPDQLLQSIQTFMGTRSEPGLGTRGPLGEPCCDDQGEAVLSISGAELRLGTCAEGHSQEPRIQSWRHLDSSTLGPGLLCRLCLSGFPIPFLGSPKSSLNSAQGNPELAPGATKAGA